MCKSVSFVAEMCIYKEKYKENAPEFLCVDHKVPGYFYICKYKVEFWIGKRLVLFMPFPVSDFFQILSVFSDVLFVFNQFVVHLLNQE